LRAGTRSQAESKKDDGQKNNRHPENLEVLKRSHSRFSCDTSFPEATNSRIPPSNGQKPRALVQFAQDLSPRFEMTDYLACHFERIARNLSSLHSAIHSNRTTSKI
jgi:hypothetical protein